MNVRMRDAPVKETSIGHTSWSSIGRGGQQSLREENPALDARTLGPPFF